MPVTLIKPKKPSKKSVEPASKSIEVVPKETTSKRTKELEDFEQLIAQCQKIGAELYDKGLIKPCDPIR
jgi:hypothetical protein